MKLTARKVETITKPGKHVDDFGLALRVSPKGRKTWNQRLTVRGKQVESAIGRYPAMSLAEARDEAYRRWNIAQTGNDPRTDGADGKPAVPTFAEAMAKVIAIHSPTWRNPKSGQQWESSLTTYASSIMAMPVSDIEPRHVMEVLTPIWAVKRETARRVKQRISAICRWAIAQGHRMYDPAGNVLDSALPRVSRQRKHHDALPYDRIAECLQAVRAAPRALPGVKLSLEFAVLTACRSSEVRKARWDEIDFENRVFEIPASRMKANRPHRVPLSPRCIEILEVARELNDGCGLVFPGLKAGTPISEVTHVKLLRQLGFDVTLHGFRSTFRDWASEQTATPHAVMEQALAHTIKNKAEAAYARSDLFAKRRLLHDQWADHCVDVEAGNVMAFPSRDSA
ncbi:MAG: integrase arm-type DNA-binding domain-containing protein [Gammaproteobacteria bacterium]|nr:integrase arm-type DNA-binding domain-containing protein [Gammaproteobacteria bacterium]MDE0273537.1 integrase arm-type DNA-binding domain-containing protein [Gammaproteobacteria bacterium]